MCDTPVLSQSNIRVLSLCQNWLAVGSVFLLLYCTPSVATLARQHSIVRILSTERTSPQLEEPYDGVHQVDTSMNHGNIIIR